MTISDELSAYASKVVKGKIPAGKFHKAACKRHLRDRRRAGARAFPYEFRDDLAERFFDFASEVKHYKGKWAGERVVLTDCQRFRLGSLVAWVHVDTGLRRFRTAYNELPRKQGKSLEAAIVVVYLTFFDGEAGAEGYCAATKRDQAKIVFSDAKMLVRASPDLRARIKPHAWNLHQADTASKVEPLSADHDSLDGLNPSVIIVDEFHAHKDRGMIDVLETATGAREQPTNFQITTAGDDPLSPCGEQHDYACKVLEGVIEDETLFAFIAHADSNDDPFSPSTWRKANPHYGISVNPEDLAALANKARHIPSALAAFKQKRLNVWVASATPWLDLERWEAGQTDWGEDEMVGDSCYGAVDLASKIDLATFTALFPPTDERATWRLLTWYFTPEDGLEDRARKFRAPLGQWVVDGWITTNPGNRIDPALILETVIAQAERFDLIRFGFDPWNIGGMDLELGEALGDSDGERILEVPQSMASLSEPSKEFEAEVGAGRVDAGGDPVLRWMASNVIVDRDSNDNIRPTKNPKKLRGRIDGIVSAVIALKLAQRDREDLPAYTSERGIATVGIGVL